MVSTQGKFRSGKCLIISKLMDPRPRTFTGSTDVNCKGLVSSSGNATTYQRVAKAAASAHKRKQSIIIGICTTLGFLVLVGLAGATCLWMRRRRQRERKKVALSPHSFVDLEKTRPAQVLYTNSDLNQSRKTGPSALAATSASHITSSRSQGSVPPTVSPSNNDPVHITRPTVTNSNSNAYSTISGSTAILTISIRGNVEVEGGVVFQHRDGIHIVYELPPPYLDQVEAGHSSPS